MASRGQSIAAAHSLPRLYLVARADTDGPLITQVLGAADLAAVLLHVPENEQPELTTVKALAPRVQERGAALLVAEHAELAASAGADGVHVEGQDALRTALPIFKPDRIVGCGGLSTRHEAMLAGEAGADYVMFGEPDRHGFRPSFEAMLERVRWWAQLFEIPCVGFAASLAEVHPLAAAGADFVALGECLFADRRGCAVAAREAAQQLSMVERVA